MSYYLFLDDTRQPNQVTWMDLPSNVAWVRAKSYDDFVYVIDQMGLPFFISYDCDLCQEHYDAYFEFQEGYTAHYKEFKTKCGIDCVRFMVEYCKKLKVKHPAFLIHTQNKYALPFMDALILSYNSEIQEATKAIEPTILKPNSWRAQSKVPKYAIHSDAIISGFFGPYRFLSNFWPAPVQWKGLNFPSVEVAYQAAKCAQPNDMLSFIGVGASDAKKLGRKITILSDWNERKLDVMRYLVMQKFGDDVLRAQLISTGDIPLIEANAWKDTFWGVYWKFDVGTCEWKCLGGANHLGGILMDARKLLR